MMSSRQYPQFLLLGDSIIQNGCLLRDGFCLNAGLAEHCLRRLEIINRGLSGYNTANELVILPELIPAPSCATVEYLLVLLGANDACLPSSPSKQHVSLEKYRQNLTEIITHPSVTAHSPTILLVTPPPVNEYQILAGNIASGYSEVTRRAETTAQYAQVVREIAVELKEKNVVLIDLWTALMEKALSSTPPDIVQGLNGTLLGSQLVADSQALRDLLVDGLHLTGAGYSVFLSEIIPVVGKGWAQEPLDNPTWVFPHWIIAPRNDDRE